MKRMLIFIYICVAFGCSSSSSNPPVERQGDLDMTFNIPYGYALYGGWNKDSYMGTAIQVDDNILVSIGILNGTDSDAGVLRYNADGSLDKEFGTGGVFIYDGGHGDDNGRRLALQQGNKIVVVGNTFNGTDYDALSLRYTADGAADAAFGNAGAAIFNLGKGDDWGEAVVIQTDQNIIVVGGIGSTATEVLTMRIIGSSIFF